MSYVEISKDVRWTIVPCEDGSWELRKCWRYKTHNSAPDDEWKRIPTLSFSTLSEVLLGLGCDFRENSVHPRSLQVKLGPTSPGADLALVLERERR